jgi:hypothetical protein
MGVFGKRGHERQMNVYMGVDEAREDQFPRRIDDFGPGRSGEVKPDLSDRFIFDKDVAA